MTGLHTKGISKNDWEILYKKSSWFDKDSASLPEKTVLVLLQIAGILLFVPISLNNVWQRRYFPARPTPKPPKTRMSQNE